jgi:F-actin capping protein, beta subunit
MKPGLPVYDDLGRCDVMDMYVCRYFEGGVSSVFLWDLEDGGFAGVVLLKKSMCIFFITFIP